MGKAHPRRHLWEAREDGWDYCKMCGGLDNAEWPVRLIPEECPAFDQEEHDKFFAYLKVLRRDKNS